MSLAGENLRGFFLAIFISFASPILFLICKQSSRFVAAFCKVRNNFIPKVASVPKKYYFCTEFQSSKLISYLLTLEIEEIYPPHIYSVRYEGRDENEFDRLFRSWNDVDCVISFIEGNKDFLKDDIWVKVSEPEDAAKQVLTEAEDLEKLFETLYENSKRGGYPDYDSYFHYLEGKYKYELEWIPMKSYGTVRPSLLRLYAIKMDSNVYLITGGGIKLADTIQNSPRLKDYVLQDIDRVRRYLCEQGIFDSDDMNRY